MNTPTQEQVFDMLVLRLMETEVMVNYHDAILDTLILSLPQEVVGGQVGERLIAIRTKAVEDLRKIKSDIEALKRQVEAEAPRIVTL